MYVVRLRTFDKVKFWWVFQQNWTCNHCIHFNVVLFQNKFNQCWSKARYFFDLPDYLTWRATGALSRSFGSLFVNWHYLASHLLVFYPRVWQLNPSLVFYPLAPFFSFFFFRGDVTMYLLLPITHNFTNQHPAFKFTSLHQNILCVFQITVLSGL